MGINIDSLKVEFKEYLLERGIIKENTDDTQEEKDVSIFAHRNEFQKFVEDKYNVEFDSLSANLSKLADLEIQNGKLVFDDENLTDNMDDVDKVYQIKDLKDSDNESLNTFVLFLNMLFDDSEFVDKIDDDGSLDDEEIKKFLVYASGLDDDEKSLSFDEVLTAMQNANDGTYDKNSVSLDILDEISKVDDKEEIEDTEKVSAPSGGGSGVSSSGYNPNTTQTDTQSETPKKDLTKLSLEELETEKTQRLSDVNKAQDFVKESYGQYNEWLTENQKQLEGFFDQQTDLDEETKNVILNYRNQITEQKSLINDSKTKVVEFETSLVGLESDKKIAQGKLSSTQAALSAIPEDDEEHDYSAQRAALESAIAELEAQIAALDEQINQTTQQRDTEKANLQTLEEGLAQIESDENEDKIKYDEAKEKLDEEQAAVVEQYELLMQSLDTQIVQQEQSVQDCMASLHEVEDEIIKRNDKQIQDEYSTEESEFDPEGNGYEWLEMERKDGVLPYDVISPKNANPDEELPVLVYLHGQGSDHKDIYEQVLKDYGLETWNGYILCLDNDDVDSWLDNEKDIDKVVKDFASQRKIDKDRISLAGYSLGGSGVISFSSSGKLTDSDGYTFRNAAIITGYNQPKGDFDVPIIAFNDANTAQGDSVMSNQVAPRLDTSENGKDVIINTGADHGDVDYQAFTWDANNNGKADIFEFMEGSLKDNS